MVEEILGFLQKNFIYLGLKKNAAIGLQDGLAGYIKAVHYCCFALPIYIIPIQNEILNISRENVIKSDKRVA